MNSASQIFFDAIKSDYAFLEGANPDLYHQNLEEWRKVIKQAKKEFFKDLMKKNLKLKAETGKLGPKYLEIVEENEKLGLLKATQGADKRNTRYLWLTISPKPKVKLEDFIHKLDKFAKRSMFLNYKYTLEQRGTTESTMGKGFHAHLLLERSMKYKPSKVEKNSENTWKNITNVKNKEIWYFKWCPSEYLEDKREYMRLGGKTGDGKADKQTIDILWRKKNNIKTFYESEVHE